MSLKRFFLLLSIVFFCFTFPGISLAKQPSRNVMFHFPHLLGSPYTLQAGQLVYGTSIGLGITDQLQIGTGILRDFYGFYNVNTKLAVVETWPFSMALTLGYENYPKFNVSTWLPGTIMAFALHHRLAWFLGGNFSFSERNNLLNGEPFVRGTTVQSDLSWMYQQPSRKKRVKNVISAGVSYDVTYEQLGVGLSHHWSGFQLGAHYYLNAGSNAVQPIISGGGILQL